MPSPEDTGRIQARAEADPELMAYFAVQWDDYVVRCRSIAPVQHRFWPHTGPRCTRPMNPTLPSLTPLTDPLPM